MGWSIPLNGPLQRPPVLRGQIGGFTEGDDPVLVLDEDPVEEEDLVVEMGGEAGERSARGQSQQAAGILLIAILEQPDCTVGSLFNLAQPGAHRVALHLADITEGERTIE